MAVSLELLTDEAIVDYSRSDGKDRIITDHRDLNLQSSTKIDCRPGGVYDVEIFGSPMEDRCICGKLQKPSLEPCPHCGARVFTKEEGLRRFARVELPFYYLNELRFDSFKELFDEIFSDSKIIYDFFGDDLTRNGYSSRGKKKLGIKAFDTCQFEYRAKEKILTVSEFITDKNKCSYEGILSILEEHFPEKVPAYKKLINRLYLIQPAMMRPFSLFRAGRSAKMVIHSLSTWYTILIRFCCVEAKESNDLNYEAVCSMLKTDGEVVRYTALLRAFINASKRSATELLNTSKKNLARKLYAVRTKSSARCPIVPDVNLPIDELSVPVHIAYDLCREGFIGYLQNELNFSYKEAEKATKYEADNPETMKLFKEYAEKQIVLRNPQVR